MAKKEYKPTMLTLESYNILDEAKRFLRRNSATRVTFSAVIKEFVQKRLILENLDPQVKDYIYSFINEMAIMPCVKGVVLFGSVAKGDWNKYSDIDLFIVVNENELAFYNGIFKAAIDKMETKHRQLIDKDLYLDINPLIISIPRLNDFSSVFLDVLDYGIVLYDIDGTMEKFLNSLRMIRHKRVNTSGVEVLEWK